MKDLGPLHHFIGITTERWPLGLFLHQRQYTIDILERAGMSNCKPCSTPVDTHAKLSEDDGPPVADATSYRSLIGALQYLTFSRSDIAYVVQQLVVYTNADWTGCPDTRWSISGYVVFLGAKLVSWTAKRQHVISCSSTEAEYRVVAEASWMRQLFHELHSPLQRATLIYCDNHRN
eukprot:XP_020398085.1 uncharacterized protein LOC109941481 [Zea mays]